MKIFISISIAAVLLTGCAMQEVQQEWPADAPYADTPAGKDAAPKDMRKEIGREFLLAVGEELQFVSDPEVLSFINGVGKSILESAGSDPKEYHFFVIRSNEINAFAVPGGYIFLYDGLIRNMESVDELAGVVAHEIAHVERDHHFKDSAKEALADLATIAGVIVGSSQARENPEAPIAIATSSNIAYKLKLRRKHEEDADLFAIRYLKGSKYQPKGLSSFFKKLSLAERLNSSNIPAYLSTHPGVIERETIVETLIKDIEPPEGGYISSKDDWERIITILKAERGDKFTYTRRDEGQYDREREHYLMGLHSLKSGDFKRAISEYKEALGLNPENQIYHSDISMAYMRSQNMDLAKVHASKAIELSEDNASPYIVLGLAAKNEGSHEEAARYLSRAMELRPDDPFIHYHISASYHALNMHAAGYYHMAQYFRLNLKQKNAIGQLHLALRETRVESFAKKIKEEIKRIERDGI